MTRLKNPTSKLAYCPKSLLAVFAHPDDVDFGSSGSIYKWVKGGCQVFYLVATNGNKGSSDPTMNSGKLAQRRRREQLSAAKLLGIKKVFFLNHNDSELEPTLKLKEEIVKVIRQTKPEVVLTFDPEMRYSATRGYINHPDHIAIGEATLAAVYPLARDRLTFPNHIKKGLSPHKVKEVLLVNFEKPNLFIDITETFEKKLEAIKCHTSQINDFPALFARMRDWASTLGKKINVQYAEGFRRIAINF